MNFHLRIFTPLFFDLSKCENFLYDYNEVYQKRTIDETGKKGFNGADERDYPISGYHGIEMATHYKSEDSIKMKDLEKRE